MDLLAAIAADPTLLPLWAVMIFAAGMYPVGMMFGCSPCCGPVCKSCCRDEVSQIVVDFNLEATGEQFIRELPITGEPPSGSPITVDGKGGAPQFILEGQQSGAKLLCSASGNYEGSYAPTISPNPGRLYPMGAAFRTEFLDGESVTATPVGFSPEQIESPNLTAVVGECPVWRDSFGYPKAYPAGEVWPVSFSGSPGKWRNPQWADDEENYYRGDGMPAVSSLTVDCQGDDGTVIFDVPEHNGKQPGDCDWCNPIIERYTAHPANRILNPCDAWDGIGGYHIYGYTLTAEASSLSVSVPLLSTEPCETAITASAVIGWGGVSGEGSESRTETYTLNRQDQDCYPFSEWTKSPPPPCGMTSLITLSALSQYGEGFSGIAIKPDDSPGAITEVQITNGGSGYALTGRIAPSVAITGGSGNGADIVVNLVQGYDYYDGLPVWRIDSVFIGPGGGGSGYSWWDSLTVTAVSPGVTSFSGLLGLSVDEDGAITGLYVYGSGAFYQESSTVPGIVPDIKIVIGQSEPSNGIGAVITPTVDTNPASATFGSITALSIGGVEAYVEPTLTITPPAGGSGAVLEAAGYILRQGFPADGYYAIDGVRVVSGGSGYTNGAECSVSLGSGDQRVGFAPILRVVTGAGGAITGVSLSNPSGGEWKGAYRKVLAARDGGHRYLARAPAPCSGPGGLYLGHFWACGDSQWKFPYGMYTENTAQQGPAGRTYWHHWRRACPDYTYEISIQAAE